MLLVTQGQILHLIQLNTRYQDRGLYHLFDDPFLSSSLDA
jgi:hypothetical protein